MSSIRWRVLILDDHERSRAVLRAAVWQARGEVVAEARRCADVLALVQRFKPDIAVYAVGLADGDGIETAARVTAETRCPVVLLTSHVAPEVIDRAPAAGIMGFLLKPLRAAALAPTLDLALARFREAEQLRLKLEERKVVERAKGLLMTRHGLSEDDAFRRLRRAAMDSRRPMIEVARALLVSDTVAGSAAVDRGTVEGATR